MLKGWDCICAKSSSRNTEHEGLAIHCPSECTKGCCFLNPSAYQRCTACSPTRNCHPEAEIMAGQPQSKRHHGQRWSLKLCRRQRLFTTCSHGDTRMKPSSLQAQGLCSVTKYAVSLSLSLSIQCNKGIAVQGGRGGLRREYFAVGYFALQIHAKLLHIFRPLCEIKPLQKLAKCLVQQLPEH